MAEVHIQSLNKKFDEVHAVKDVNLQVRRGEIYGQLVKIRDRYAEQIRTRFPKIPRRVSGYNLDQLLPENGFHVARALVGTEGTCVTVLEATVRLVPSPPFRSLVALGYPDIFHAADQVTEMRGVDIGRKTSRPVEELVNA